MPRSRLTELAKGVRRLSYGGMSVDLVATSKGIIRLGSMPDIAKFLVEHDIHEEMVVVPHWQSSLAGDNRCGEEFILWHGNFLGRRAKKYLGLPHNVLALAHHLGRIFPYFFDEKGLEIVHKKWLANWFIPVFADPLYRDGDLKLDFTGQNILIYQGGQLVYDYLALAAAENTDEDIQALLASVARDGRFCKDLEIQAIGCGNGFYGTVANSIVRFNDTVIWIDPCGYPAHTLARHGLHWDDITHYLFTHNHEDHVQGFSACIARAKKLQKKIKILAAKPVFDLLMELYQPLYPDLASLTRLMPLIPGVELELDGMKIESRLNHHILPYGTLGLKISAGGSCLGYSGDTKYDEKINAILQRKELSASWFAPCDLIFHEIDFDNPEGVHTHWQQVARLQSQVSGRVLGYHSKNPPLPPFALAREGRCYRL